MQFLLSTRQNKLWYYKKNIEFPKSLIELDDF